MTPHHPCARRAFAVHGLAVALVIILLSLCAYIVYFRLTAIPPGSGITSKLSPSQTITTYSVIALFMIGVSGGIGALTYFLSGRRQTAANAAICLVLTLGIAVLGYSLLHNRAALASAMQRIASAQPTPAAAQSPAASVPPRPAPRIAPPPTQPAERPAMRASPPSSPSTPAPAVPAVPATPAEPDIPAAHTKALAAFLDGFDADVAAYRATLASTITLVRSSPPRSRTQLAERIKAARTLATDSSTLRDRAMNIHTAMRQHLSARGLSEIEAPRIIAEHHDRVFAFSTATHDFMRASIAADLAASEAQLLLDNYNAWSLAAGKITSRDNVLLARLKSVRASTLSASEPLVPAPAPPATPASPR